MESDMLAMAIKAALIISDPARLGFLAFGVFLGLVLGVIPGLGGLVGLSLLLPFTFNMDPFSALALMMGLASVTVTSDTIPAVLFGVPGTVGSAATILDGHPMAQKGEASRAFGAAFTASVVGGLIGAAILAVSVPVLRPIMLYIGTPELLAICILGLSLVATLSGGAPLKGLTAGCIGLMVATIGEEAQTGEIRWAGDFLYLVEGLPIVPLALGLFAIPELASMAINRSSIAAKLTSGIKPQEKWGQLQGVRDVLNNWFLVIRCSAIGSTLGAVPGIGASVIDWIAYGHASRSEKGASETFGKGDVRGVIASESSNNAKEGGALIPTVAFGVPGSASMTLLLGAFLIHGITPGPKMLTSQLDITYTLVWSVALANILGAGICFIFANQLARIALIRSGILVPVVLAVTFIGAFQGSRDWGDIYALLIFGVIGWIMKQKGWPRPPLVLGFVLGGLVENYMFISVNRYGTDWMARPIVMIILAITIFGLLRPYINGYLNRRKSAQKTIKNLSLGFQKESLSSDNFFALVIFSGFVVTLYLSKDWELAAKLVPQVISLAGVSFTGIFLILSLFVRQKTGSVGRQNLDITADHSDLSGRVVYQRASVYFGWCLLYISGATIIGLIPALFFFMAGYLRYIGRESWRMTFSVAFIAWTFCYILFHHVLLVPWPETVVGKLFPALKSIRAFNLF
jgi:TctA family transporter